MIDYYLKEYENTFGIVYPYEAMMQYDDIDSIEIIKECIETNTPYVVEHEEGVDY